MDETKKKEREASIDIDMEAYTISKLRIMVGSALAAAATFQAVGDMSVEDIGRVGKKIIAAKRKEFDEILVTALRSTTDLVKEIAAELGIETADSLSQPAADS